MNKDYKKLGLLILTLLCFQLPLVGQAQEPPAKLEPLEDIPPPIISNDDNPDAPKITIIKKQGETIEEYRINGQLYMMKVTPAHGIPYYMHKEDQNGGWLMDGPNQPMIIPKWTLFRF